MKTLFSFAIAALFGITTLTAQTKADIFLTSKTPITYIGLDFSRVKLVGAEGFTDPAAIKNEYFDKWNNLVLSESDKYDLKKTFLKETVDFDLSPVEPLNDAVDFIDLVINQSATKLTAENLTEMAGRYDFKGFQNKIALVFIVESFDKIAEMATFYAAFINTENNQIIFWDKVTGEPRGFGLRNYWAGAFYNALESIRTKKWKLWKKAANS